MSAEDPRGAIQQLAQTQTCTGTEAKITVRGLFSQDEHRDRGQAPKAAVAQFSDAEPNGARRMKTESVAATGRREIRPRIHYRR